MINDVAASGEASHVYPLRQAWTTSILHAGQFTAACGVEIYRGDLLSPQYQGNSFTCEPTGNLVHREVLKPAGASFLSHPGREGVEFLASPDTWFRPVNLETGPDGALYVVDMYRCVIEHPQFVPDELKARPDLRYGDDRGRIYRIVPAHREKPAQQAMLASLSSADLVGELEAKNSWRRETAARLIYERHDKSIAPALTRLAKTGNDPRARVHALWALAGLEQMTDEVLRTALDDANPRVREQAAAMSESRFKEAAELRQRLLNLAADDVWTRRAVAPSVPDRPGRLLGAVLQAQPPAGLEAGESALVGELAQLAGARKIAEEISAVVVDLANTAD